MIATHSSWLIHKNVKKILGQSVFLMVTFKVQYNVLAMSRLKKNHTLKKVTKIYLKQNNSI